jgi:hypothetical protein
VRRFDGHAKGVCFSYFSPIASNYTVPAVKTKVELPAYHF